MEKNLRVRVSSSNPLVVMKMELGVGKDSEEIVQKETVQQAGCCSIQPYPGQMLPSSAVSVRCITHKTECPGRIVRSGAVSARGKWMSFPPNNTHWTAKKETSVEDA
ncbi:hypothetical protein ZHAS_00011646 [Anopheles sinensis]|uniref:Uncharacterized protein n=1 Tax=Anopheles sinensis TaxID=74873 RepID=A0A084W0R0_ANOSI|nr:hypothetical protein ZHAS_00011646 [Anopheles sinensis]